jgi:hypothetical protein
MLNDTFRKGNPHRPNGSAFNIHFATITLGAIVLPEFDNLSDPRECVFGTQFFFATFTRKAQGS